MKIEELEGIVNAELVTVWTKARNAQSPLFWTPDRAPHLQRIIDAVQAFSRGEDVEAKG